MADAEAALARFEDMVRRYDLMAGMFLTFASNPEGDGIPYQSLVAIEEYVAALDDSRLSSVYDRLTKGHHTFIPGGGDNPAIAYNELMERLTRLSLGPPSRPTRQTSPSRKPWAWVAPAVSGGPGGGDRRLAEFFGVPGGEAPWSGVWGVPPVLSTPFLPGMG